MFDAHLRPIINPWLDFLGKRIVSLGVSANTLTLLGFLFGLLTILGIVQEYYFSAGLCLMINRLLDGLDGAVARHSKLSDFGGFLDIVCDFLIYAGIVFAFAFTRPEHPIYAAFLLFSFIGPMVSFLAYAILAAKRNKETTRRGVKSFYHLGGLCEGTETFAVLLLMCLFPVFFSYFAIGYGILCWLTTLGRVWIGYKDFS